MIKDIIDFLRPPLEADPKKQHLWQTNVSITLGFMVAFCFWSLTKYGFALADDVQGRVEKAVEPLRVEIATIKKVQAEQSKQQAETKDILKRLSDQITDQLVASTGSQIRLLTGKRCKERDPTERERINREIEKLQLTYRQQTGDRLQIRCDEL